MLSYRLAQTQSCFYCLIRKIVGHKNFSRSRYHNRKILDFTHANDLIFNKLEDNEPFLAARFGDAELRALVLAIEIKNGLRNKFPDHLKHVMHMNAGFFPATDDNLLEFADVLYDAAKKVNVWGVWFNYMEDYIIEQTSPKSDLIKLEALEPYRVNNPWSRALQGKKVLVVHPFEASIRSQYERHEKLFSNQYILPDFELITYKSVQTNAGGSCKHNNWFIALDSMYNDIQRIDFDVAIVGCGSYGLPLAAKIKDLNKKVIHLAGATQMLFGIRGARWDVRPELQHLFNEYWIRPNKNERPKDASSVEGACYW